MKYLMIGAGAIGSYIGASLLDGGCEVAYLEKEEHAIRLQESGLRVRTPRKLLRYSQVQVATSPATAFNCSPDVVVFAMKSFDTADAALEIKPYRENFQTVLCLQNGVENEITLEQTLDPACVIAGSVTSAVSRQQVGEVTLEKERGIGLENRGSLSEKIWLDFERANLHPQLYASRAHMKWSKLLSNLLGNATCAILGMTPAEIFNDPDLFHLETLQVKETLDVMHANGWQPVNLPETPVALLSWLIRNLPESLNRRVLKYPLGGGRGKKMPSFYLDLHAGRPRSEVDYLNGAVVRFGKDCGIATPVNATLARVLRMLVEDREKIPAFDHNKQALMNEVAKTDAKSNAEEGD